MKFVQRGDYRTAEGQRSLPLIPVLGVPDPAPLERRPYLHGCRSRPLFPLESLRRRVVQYWSRAELEESGVREQVTCGEDEGIT